MKYLIKFLKRKIISISFFWKLRHLFQSSWINSYNKKSTHELYFDIISDNNISSILDFGCATGTLLYDLNKRNPNLICYGIDINKEAINVCKTKFEKLNVYDSNFFFDYEFNLNNLVNFLDKNNLAKFDLMVFDRVLYCFNDKDLDLLIDSLLRFTNTILIDDFEVTEEFKIQGYRHRDWSSLLNKYNFENVMNIPTIYTKVDLANARTLFFKQKY